MDISTIAKGGLLFVKRNSSSILTGLGVAGSLGSTVLAIKAMPNALHKLDLAFLEKNEGVNEADVAGLTPFEVVKTVWKDFIPAAGTEVITIVCVVGAQSINLRKQAAMISGITVLESAFREYQDRITAEAPAKDRKVRDDIARAKVDASPVSTKEVIIVGNGDQLFYDERNDRYFESTKQKVDKAVNELLYTINGSGYASLNDFYSEIGIKRLPDGDELGWTPEHPIEVDFSTQMTDDDRAAIVITFVRKPLHNYYKGFQ